MGSTACGIAPTRTDGRSSFSLSTTGATPIDTENAILYLSTVVCFMKSTMAVQTSSANPSKRNSMSLVV